MKVVRIFFALIIMYVLAMMLNRAYIVIGVSSWNGGCNEAAAKFGKDYGLEYKTYMEKFCNGRLVQMQQQFKLEE